MTKCVFTIVTRNDTKLGCGACTAFLSESNASPGSLPGTVSRAGREDEGVPGAEASAVDGDGNTEDDDNDDDDDDDDDG